MYTDGDFFFIVGGVIGWGLSILNFDGSRGCNGDGESGLYPSLLLEDVDKFSGEL